MEWFVYGVSIFFSVGIILYVIRKPGTKDWLLVYFLSAAISIVLGVIVVEEGWIQYPFRLLPNYFDSAILFELLSFPAINMLYNHTSLHVSRILIAGQALLYSGLLTLAEVGLEWQTNVIRYTGWTWYDTFLSMAAVMLFVRVLMAWIRRVAI